MISQLSRRRLYYELKAALQGEVVLPGQPLYEQSVTLWNAAVKTRPAIIALCKNVRDVTSAVSIAEQHHWNITVKGGGHGWSGLALSEDGLVIDLSGMRGVTIYADQKEAEIEGGATAGDLLAAADKYDLVAVTGAGSTIGMAALTMGGGYGPLTPKYGLALDNLISAVLVLANGRVVTVSDTENRDLFWAIRGGGGNFGVVVSMKIRLYDAEQVLSGQFYYPWSEAANIMMYCNEYVRSAPDNLSLITGVVSGTGGDPVVIVALSWFGDIKVAERCFGDFKNACRPMDAKIRSMRYKELLAEFDAFVTLGNCNDMKTRWLIALTEESLAIFLKAGMERTSPLSTITLQYFYGKPTRLPLSSTAFGLREPHILVLITSTWTVDDDDSRDVHQTWGRNLCDALAPHSFAGGYPNVLTRKDTEQVLYAYGTNLPKLQRVKSFFDPEHIFKSFPIAIPEPLHLSSQR
jgi:FAD/FMN-containing dehydrogenase